MPQNQSDSALGPVEPELGFPVPLRIRAAVKVVAETLLKRHACLVKMALFGDDIAYEETADLDDQEEVVDRSEGPDLEPLEDEFLLDESEEILDGQRLLYA